MKPFTSRTSITKDTMRKEVPYFSQYDEDIPEEWRKRSCGITSLRMALGAALPGVPLPTVRELIEEGVESGAYIENVGWSHQGLVNLAEKYGARAFRGEYRMRPQRYLPNMLKSFLNKFLLSRGVATLYASIEVGLVPIVSVTVEGKADTHLVPLVGFGSEGGEVGFYYHEPAAEPGQADAQFRFMNIKDFSKRWRRLAIFVGPRSESEQEKSEVRQSRMNMVTPPLSFFAVRWVLV